MKQIDFFRKATKAIVAEKPKPERRQYKENIAASAGIEIPQLDDLVMGRRVGNEQLRRKIASFLGFKNYDDFLFIGEELLNGATLEQAKALLEKQKLLRPDPDGSIERILTFWPKMTEKQKKELRQYQRMMLFNDQERRDHLNSFKEHSKDRFYFLWESVSGEEKEILLRRDAVEFLEEYEKGKRSDADVLEFADVYYNKIVTLKDSF